MIKVLVSACLLGAPVRYDGGDKHCAHPILQRWIAEGRTVPVCPEMLGGLGTPRAPAEIIHDRGSRRVVTAAGEDVTSAFEIGAGAAADESRMHGARVAVLKSGSPSCGTSFVYDGTFSQTPVAGEGVTTAALRSLGVIVFSEQELEAAADHLALLERNAGSDSPL